MRVLVASTGGAGHFNPLVPFIEALHRRGDQVLIVGPPELKAMAEATGQPFESGAAPTPRDLNLIWHRFPTLPPREAAVLINRELFGRLCTAAMLPAVERAIEAWRPDLVLRDPCEYASAIVAGRSGILHAQVAISQARIEASSLTLAARSLEPHRSGIVAKIRAAPYLTRFPATLDPAAFSDTRRFAESAAARNEPLPDWWGGSDAPLVYVTFGSIAGGLPIGPAAYRAVLNAIEGLHARVLLTVGRTTDLHSIGSVPASVHVEAWVPQRDVLAAAQVVVCHGGSGTTFGALAAGVPLVMVPMWADQPANARAVAAAGAGRVVAPGAGGLNKMYAIETDDAPRIRAAIESVLADRSHQEAASRIAAEMREYPTIDSLLATLGSGRPDG